MGLGGRCGGNRRKACFRSQGHDTWAIEQVQGGPRPEDTTERTRPGQRVQQGASTRVREAGSITSTVFSVYAIGARNIPTPGEDGAAAPAGERRRIVRVGVIFFRRACPSRAAARPPGRRRFRRNLLQNRFVRSRYDVGLPRGCFPARSLQSARTSPSNKLKYETELCYERVQHPRERTTPAPPPGRVASRPGCGPSSLPLAVCWRRLSAPSPTARAPVRVGSSMRWWCSAAGRCCC